MLVIVVMATLCRLCLDLGPHGVHVDFTQLPVQILEDRFWEGAGLGVEDDLVTEDHQGGDGLDPESLGELDLGVRVDLGEDDVVVTLGGGLEHGSEAATRAAPFGPEVDDHGVVAWIVSSKFSLVSATVGMRLSPDRKGLYREPYPGGGYSK